MASESQSGGNKRSKAFYRKSAYGAKKHCTGINRLEPGIQGFLVTCNHDERSAVRESYNILNEYADNLYGPDKNAGLHVQTGEAELSEGTDDECDDVEKALQKEVEELKRAAAAPEKRFQNVATKAKNCVFIRTSLANPAEVTTSIMEDIAEKHLKKARYAARILPILGTCKANTKEIEKLASDVLKPIFSVQSDNVPASFTVLFKMRNNQGTACGRESVIPAVTKVVQDINPKVKFSWTDYSTAVIIEVVCTVCCLGVAPDYTRLRKYNLQELQQGAKDCKISTSPVVAESSERKSCNESGLVATEFNEKGNEDESINCDNKQKEENGSRCDEEKNEEIVVDRTICDTEDACFSKNDGISECTGTDHAECEESKEKLSELNS